MKLLKQPWNLWLFVIFFAPYNASAQQIAVLKSPDGNIVFSLKLKDRKPFYQVAHKGKMLVGESELGFVFKEGGAFGAGIRTPKVVFSKVDNYYELSVGKTKTVHDVHKQVLIPLIEDKADGRQINLVVRAFNDGLAFRFEFPEQKNWDAYTMTEENTSFNLTGNPRVRTLIFDHYNNNHEGLYQKMPLSGLKDGQLMDMPVLFEFPDKQYLAITEASLRDYAGMYLSKNNGVLKSQLSPLQGQQELKVKAVLPHQTPLAGDDDQ